MLPIRFIKESEFFSLGVDFFTPKFSRISAAAELALRHILCQEWAQTSSPSQSFWDSRNTLSFSAKIGTRYEKSILFSDNVNQIVIIFLVLVFSLSGCRVSSNKHAEARYGYKIVNSYPHDKDAFTEGLIFEDGVLYESTGLYGASSLRKVELKTGAILMAHKLQEQFFGEGITLYKNKIIQLTWRSHTGFIYNKDNFMLIGQFYYPFEGWGITYDGKRLIVSNGTPKLHFLNPETFKEESTLKVYDTNGPLNRINELEYIRGKIYANIWQTEYIAEINPETGEVSGWVDLKGLVAPYKHDKPFDVLNGIAYDKDNNRLFVTGKLWPRLFEIKLVRQE